MNKFVNFSLFNQLQSSNSWKKKKLFSAQLDYTQSTSIIEEMLMRNVGLCPFFYLPAVNYVNNKMGVW